MTNDQSVVDHTIGRATNDVLEQAVAVWFKDEGAEGGHSIGPVYIQVGGSAPDNDSNPMDGELVPYRKGDEAEWHTDALAEALAKEIGVPVVWS